MNNSIIKIIYINNSKEISFSVDKETTFNVPTSQLYNLEHWLNTETTSIMVTCSNGCKVGLNKYNVQYAEILCQ
mgnify:CR=1 FL=1